MDWFYAENGKQVGPVDDTELEERIRAGRLDPSTLIWREGMAEWQPLSVARSPGLPPVPPPVLPHTGLAPRSVCVECRRELPESDMIVLNRSWVCGDCKPIFVQRLKEGAATVGGEVWRYNKRQFILTRDTPMPDRCVKCNAPANGQRLKRKLMWHHPAVYLVILLNLLIYAIVAICVRKRATILIGVCERHRRQRTTTILASWLSVLCGFALFIAGAMNDWPWVAVSAGVLFLVGALYGLIRGPLVSAARIDAELVQVRGGGREFLASLPEWPGGA